MSCSDFMFALRPWSYRECSEYREEKDGEGRRGRTLQSFWRSARRRDSRVDLSGMRAMAAGGERGGRRGQR